MAPRKEIRVLCEDLTYSLDTTLDKAIEVLATTRRTQLEKGFSRLELDVSTESDYGGGEYAKVYLYGWRLETQEEASAREQREAGYQLELEARECAQFEALKKKFS